MDEEKIIPSIPFLLKSEMKKILLVDDDPVFQAVARKMIESCQLVDYIISSFRNGKEALDHLKGVTSSPDDSLVLLDLNMPVMNGWEFLEELKKYPLLQSLKVVIVSSSPNAEDIKLSRSIEQVLDYVLKPMSMKYLSELFQKIGWKAVS